MSLPFLSQRRRREFDPRTIPGLGLWSRADASLNGLGTPATNGDTVATLSDLSGNGRTWTQGTDSNRASLVASGINGKPAWSFDGLDDRYNLSAGLDLLQNVGGATLCAVVRGSSASVSLGQTICSWRIGGADTSAGNTRAVIQRGPTNRHQVGGRRLDTDSFANANAAGTTATPVIITGILSWATAAADLLVNGAVVATNSTFQTAGLTENTPSVVARVGASATGTGGIISEFFPGLIAELLIWSRVLTSAERAMLHAYLGRRYGITVT